jgi:hypothetical protein
LGTNDVSRAALDDLHAGSMSCDTLILENRMAALGMIGYPSTQKREGFLTKFVNRSFGGVIFQRTSVSTSTIA